MLELPVAVAGDCGEFGVFPRERPEISAYEAILDAAYVQRKDFSKCLCCHRTDRISGLFAGGDDTFDPGV